MGERPVGTIGILGGGQLGRMLSVAASRLGLRAHIFSPDADSPGGQVAERVTTAGYGDAGALAEFADAVDVATFEFENVPAAALDVVEARCEVWPRRNALVVSQDRLSEKDFLRDLGLRTAPYVAVGDRSALDAALREVGTPSILKSRRLGYDGKAQALLADGNQAAGAWERLGGVASILEGYVDFSCEVSVICARGTTGEVACFEPGENVHREGILRTTTVPSRLSLAQRADAVEVTGRIAVALDYVGVMGVELFVTRDGLVVNEIAPRVHNSGHWTQDGCLVDQFEQHIRAISGWPLGDGRRHSDVVMTNLVGEDVRKVERLLSDPDVALHLYGKSEDRPGRKMGHVNRVTGAAVHPHAQKSVD